MANSILWSRLLDIVALFSRSLTYLMDQRTRTTRAWSRQRWTRGDQGPRRRVSFRATIIYSLIGYMLPKVTTIACSKHKEVFEMIWSMSTCSPLFVIIYFDYWFFSFCCGFSVCCWMRAPGGVNPTSVGSSKELKYIHICIATYVSH